MEQSQKDALKVVALRERIAQLVANYEDQIAEIRAEFTVTVDSLQKEVEYLKSSLEETVNDVVQEDEEV